MAKHVLVIYYSQSGQLKKITDSFTSPFLDNHCEVEWLEVKPRHDFPFPWSGKRFFDAMPESVLCRPAEVHAPSCRREHYDLIVFAYQPWFLSPSIPATSALHHPEIKKRLLNTPVITLIGSRNMWITAQEKLKSLLAAAGARLVGNVALFDRHNNFVSAVTIQYWMFTGKKDKFLGLFPVPGISDADIARARTYGAEAVQALNDDQWAGFQERIVAKGAVDVKTNLMFIESRASVLFRIWANTILKKKNRALWLQIFKYYLLFALFIVAPVVLLIFNLFIRPFTSNQILKKKNYYTGVNYRGNE